MSKKYRRLPDGELAIMQILWDSEAPMSRPAIEEKANQSHPQAATTILTLLSRLAEKGFVAVEKAGRGNLYAPLVSRRDYLAQESRSVLDRLFGGSLSSFALALSESGVSREELEELRRLLEEDKL